MHDVAEWASASHITTDNLVWLNIWDCDGHNCTAMVERALSDTGIPLVASCDQLYNFTIGSAMEFSRLAR
jgi:hypothetical protein